MRLRIPRGRRAEPDSRSRFPSAFEDWWRRLDVARTYFVPWVDAAVGLEGRTVLEYGCGAGPVTGAFAPRAARYIGVDIDIEAVERGRSMLAEGGVHPELHGAPEGEIIELVKGYAGEVDVLLCYAVLEHLSVAERLELLQAARDVVRPGGALVIIETPNRLTPWDYHSSQLPFLNQLPDDLALAYASRSQRAEYAEAIRDGGAEALVRWGRGVSYHELELALGDLGGRVVATGWDPRLLGEREVYREELALQRILDRARPDLSAAFSRYWLDLIVRMAAGAPATEMRPWPLQTTGAAGVGYGPNEVIVAHPGAAVELGVPETRRVTVGVENADAVALRAVATGETARGRRRPGDGTVVWCDLVVEQPTSPFELRLDAGGLVSCVLYEHTCGR